MSHYNFYAEKKVSSLGAMINRRVAENLAGILLRHLFAGGTAQKPSLLELGPGQGQFAASLLHKKELEYTAYEPQEELFAAMKKLGLNVVNKSVPPIAEERERFDAVACLNIFEHMPTISVAEELLGEINRVLKPAGVLLIVVPNYLDWGKQFFNLDYTHQTIMTESRLRNMLEDQGFALTYLGYHYGCFFSGLGRVPNALVRICLYIMSIMLPRSISRSEKIQKAGALFAENIIAVAKKGSGR